ncbi:DUF721 domain-containing protein [Pseudonocardiaceae bacterium YIM PH 21723]|nr:DUF721 domain-containing protein [Pseudonocardiaceae bacterium YIM PH 21723]
MPQTGDASSKIAPGQGSQGEPLKGSDLARAALQAARDKAKSKGTTQRRGTGVSGTGGNRRGSRLRRRWSGPGADEQRDPQPLGRLASRIAMDRGWRENLSGGVVISRWAHLVGAEVAEHSTPISLKDGELQVQASSTAWATQLRLLQKQLLSRIAAGVGNGVVKKLKIQGPTAPSWKKGPRTVQGRGPRDTYG